MPAAVSALGLALIGCSSARDAGDGPDVAEGGVERSAPEATTGSPTTSMTESSSPPSTAPPIAARPDPTRAAAEAAGWLGRGTMAAEEIELMWAGYEGASRYELHRLERADVPEPRAPDLTPATLVYEGTETGYRDTTVAAGSRYYYFLRPDNHVEGEPLRWTLADAVTDTEPPPPITGLTHAYENGEVRLQWDRGSDNYEFARYAIRRSVDGGDSEYYGTGFSIDQTSFVDDLLPEAGSVTYEIRSIDFHGNPSTPAIVTIDL